MTKPKDPETLIRYGRYDELPPLTPMADGYWTPWHVADAALRAEATARQQAEQERDRLKQTIDGMGTRIDELKSERNTEEYRAEQAEAALATTEAEAFKAGWKRAQGYDPRVSGDWPKMLKALAAYRTRLKEPTP